MWYVLRLQYRNMYPVGKTRKTTRAENYILLVLTSRLTWLCGWSKYAWLQCGDKNRTDFRVGIGVDSVVCGGRKWPNLKAGPRSTRCLCRGASKFACFCAGVKIDVFSVWGPNMTGFECGDGFCSGGRNRFGFVCGPEITWFLCEHRNWLFFVWVIEIDLVEVWGMELKFILVWRSKMTCF